MLRYNSLLHPHQGGANGAWWSLFLMDVSEAEPDAAGGGYRVLSSLHLRRQAVTLWWLVRGPLRRGRRTGGQAREGVKELAEGPVRKGRRGMADSAARLVEAIRH